jgi:hypothetical protein
MQRTIAVFALAFAAACALAQSDSNGNWTGVWRAATDGLSTVNLTLAADTGQLGGTVVLDMISRDDGLPRVIESEPHVLMTLRADDNRLSFQVRMQRPDRSTVIASFEVTRIAPDKAALHCTSCGPDAPVITLLRGQ